MASVGRAKTRAPFIKALNVKAVEAITKVILRATTLLFFPSLAFAAEANGLIVFLAIAGIPLLLALVGFSLLGSGLKKSSKGIQQPEASETKNYENGQSNKSSLFKVIGLLVNIIKLVVGLYLAFLPMQIFPNSTEVLVVNILVVALILMFRIRVYWRDRK